MKFHSFVTALYAFIVLVLFSCSNSTCKNNDGENLNLLLEYKFSGSHYSLPPVSNYPFIIRYGYSTLWETQILTVTKSGDKYFIQLIEEIPKGIPSFNGPDYKPCPKPYYKTTEKVLSEMQVNKMFEMMEDLRCISGDLEPGIMGNSNPYFGMLIKISNEVIYFSGLPFDISHLGNDNDSIINDPNKDKMKVLDFIGFLLRAGGIAPNRKLIYRDIANQPEGDSVTYQVYLFRESMVREKKVYLDGKLLAPLDLIYPVETKIRLAYDDTLHLYDRIKIKTLEWDNVEAGY
ncbi:MAG TPA: hypothetical protein ENK75_03750 [Saprospiraceae bacterium]|nr:hypothetical protein [Saprospiraceae bacterium]